MFYFFGITVCIILRFNGITAVKYG